MTHLLNYKYCSSNVIHLRRMTSHVEKLLLPNGQHLAYKKRNGDTRKPGIIFCSGFLSSLNGNKACFLDKYAEKNNLSYVRFDYNGHELSSGSMDDFFVSLWKQNTIDILDNLTEGNQILVGSSMGGWVSMLVALARPERIHSIITVANAVDSFIQRAENPDFRPKINNEHDLGSKYDWNSPYWYENGRLEDGRENSVFALGEVSIKCPVRLLHGMKDNTIPYRNSVNIAEKLTSKDVSVQLIKESDHRFSSDEDLNLLASVLDELVKKD